MGLLLRSYTPEAAIVTRLIQRLRQISDRLFPHKHEEREQLLLSRRSSWAAVEFSRGATGGGEKPVLTPSNRCSLTARTRFRGGACWRHDG
jgi:hypothetical protein